MELCSKLIPQYGVLVVKDLLDCLHPRVPGVLGMNVICFLGSMAWLC